MSVFAVLAIVAIVFLHRNRGWSLPTKSDIDWASKHEKDIEDN